MSACRKCGQPITRDQHRFGSYQTGWEHMEGECPMSGERKTNEPHDRLTRICDAMTTVFEAHPERGAAKCVVFLDDDEERKGGLVMFGWENDAAAVTAVVMHLRAIFRANGADLEIITVPNDASGIDG